MVGDTARSRGRLLVYAAQRPEDAPPARLIAWSCRRYFIERIIEDAKTEIGWDEFQAQKYRGWEHHFTLTAASLWCVAQTKLAWRQAYPRDPELARELAVEVLRRSRLPMAASC